MGGVCSCCCGSSESDVSRQHSDRAGEQDAARPDQQGSGGALSRMHSAVLTLSHSSKDNNAKDMDQIQREEDKKREAMLDHAKAKKPVARRHKRFTTQQLRVGWNTIQNCLVCSGCGWRIASVDEARMTREDDENATFIVAMDDGSATLSISYDINNYKPEAKRKKKHIDYTTSKGDLEGTLCAPVAGRVWCRENTPALLESRNAVCKGCHCFIGVRVGNNSYLCLRYIRIVDPRDNAPLFPRIPMTCASCAAVLSYTDQILCTKRRWSFGDSPSQNACYVNSLCEESITVTSPSERRLAQGKFIMADVACKCGRAVGYKFCKDLTREGRNVYQVGRYGLVTSRFHVGTPGQ